MERTAVVKFVPVHEDAILPTVARDGDVGMDLTIIGVHPDYEDVLKYGHRKETTVLYRTGLKAIPPPGYYLQIVPRSNLSKGPFRLSHSVGIIDRGYTGELFIPVDKTIMNTTQAINTSTPGVRQIVEMEFSGTIMDTKYKNSFQLILAQYVRPEPRLATIEEIPETERGEGGFGSTNQ